MIFHSFLKLLLEKIDNNWTRQMIHIDFIHKCLFRCEILHRSFWEVWAKIQSIPIVGTLWVLRPNDLKPLYSCLIFEFIIKITSSKSPKVSIPLGTNVHLIYSWGDNFPSLPQLLNLGVNGPSTTGDISPSLPNGDNIPTSRGQ